jgi:hypothetical protein
MSNYQPPPRDYAELEPPPLDYAALEPPPLDYDPALAADPYPPDAWLPDDRAPNDAPLPDVPPPGQDGLQGFEPPEPPDETWAWHDARLIGVDRGPNAGDARYEIGAMDVYTDPATGDVGAAYLPVAAFDAEAPAAGYYHDVQQQMHEAGLSPHQVPEFAERQAATMSGGEPAWRSADAAEYAAYDYARELETFDPALADAPPPEALDPLVQAAIDLGGAVVEPDIAPANDAAFQALSAIGVAADDFDPSDPPPFYDADTGTAYWIGVFQAEPDDPDNCVTSILSLGRDPATGDMAAQLAPCVPGDWDKTYAAAEYLIDVARRGGIEPVFDAAEGMALATDQRGYWEAERGVPLEPEAARDIADYTRSNWEVNL